MRILRAKISHFRSIDSVDIECDPKVTILVGKNDSGKSNLLLALDSFDSRYTFSQGDLPYGSSLRNQYDPTKPVATEMVSVSFTITPGDVSPTSILSEYAKREQVFEVTKLLNNRYRLDSEISLATTELGLQMFKEELKRIKEHLDELMKAHPGAVKWYEHVYAPSYVGYAFDSVVYKIEEGLKGGIPDSVKQDKAIVETVNLGVSRLEELRKLLSNPGTPRDVGTFLLQNREYLFVYVGDPGYLASSKKVEDEGKFEPRGALRSLLRVSKLNLKALLKTQDDMVRLSLLEDANATLEKALGPVLDILSVRRIMIDFREGELKVFAQEKSGAFSNVDEKSDGFMSLLCLYLTLLNESAEAPGGIFLIDDPGVHLHPEWQKTLRALIEQFSEQHQVVLTTHSPFLIDLSRLDRVRLVLRDEKSGKTIVKGKFYASDFDSLEPIRSGLGIHLTDSLFVGPKTLIVEGPEDYYIISGMSELCRQLGKSHLDSSEVVILADGGSSVPYFAAIASRIGPNCVVLLDADRGHDTKKRMVQKWEFREEAIILTDAVRAGAQKTSSLLRAELYGELLKKCGDDKVATGKEIFRICRDPGRLDVLMGQIGEESVDNFAKLFEMINGLFAMQ